MSLDNIDNWDDELTELAEEAKKDKGRVKKIEIKEAIKKNKAYVKETKDAIKERDKKEYDELDVKWDGDTVSNYTIKDLKAATKEWNDRVAEIKKEMEEQKRENKRLAQLKVIKIDSNKVYMKLRDMNEKDYPIYDTIIRRAKSGRKHSYLESYINFINRYFKELVRDDK